MEAVQQSNPRPLLWLLVIALGVRVHVLLVTFCVSKDALWFVPVARAAAAGDFRPLLESHQQPLYPLLIVPFHALAGSWVLSAQLASLALGTLTVIPVFLLTRRVFGQATATLGGLLAAVHPYACRFSADAVSDATYVFLFVMGVWLGCAAVTGRRLRDFALCGVFAALAWMTRPEGAGILLVVSAFAAIHTAGWPRGEWRKPATGILAAGLAFVLVAFPFLLAMRAHSGQWRLQKKKDWAGALKVAVRTVSEGESDTPTLVRDAEPRPGEVWRRLGVAVTQLGKDSAKAAGLVLPFILFGFFPRRAAPRSTRGECYVGVMIASYLVVLIAFAWSFGYLSHRHLLPLVVVGLGWAAASLSAIGNWLNRFWPRGDADPKRPLRGMAFIVCVLLLLEAAKPVRADKGGLHTAGVWLKAHGKPNAAVMAVKGAEWVVLYAEAPWLRGPEEACAHEELLRLARTQQADYLAVESESVMRTVKDFPLPDTGGTRGLTGLKLVHAQPLSKKQSHRQVYLFEVLPERAGQP